MMLSVDGIHCFHGQVHVLRDVSLSLSPGQTVCLLGRNGAGKTTTLQAIMGFVRPRTGRITLDGEELTRVPPDRIPRLGIGYVPQGRRLFPFLTVEENLRMGLLVKGHGSERLGEILELFPVLEERLRQRAGTLSGGEQQMLATARALCASPRILLMDEPSEGLMPTLVERLLETITTLKARRVGILLVEQKVDAALRLADTVVLMENGAVRYRGTPAALRADPQLLVRHLGVRR